MGDLKYEFMKCETMLDQTYFKEEALIKLINLSEEHTSNNSSNTHIILLIKIR